MHELDYEVCVRLSGMVELLEWTWLFWATDFVWADTFGRFPRFTRKPLTKLKTFISRSKMGIIHSLKYRNDLTDLQLFKNAIKMEKKRQRWHSISSFYRPNVSKQIAPKLKCCTHHPPHNIILHKPNVIVLLLGFISSLPYTSPPSFIEVEEAL